MLGESALMLASPWLAGQLTGALLTDADAAVLKQESELDADWLADWLANTGRDTLLAMAGSARAQSRPEATTEVANRLLATIGSPTETREVAQ